MGRYIKEIVSFISDFDMGLNLDKDDTILIIANDTKLTNAFNDNCNNMFSFSPEYFQNEIKNVNNRSIDYIIIDSSFNNFDPETLRKTLKTKLKNHYSDTIIIEDSKPLNIEKIEKFFAGSWYEKKEFSERGSSDNLTLYYNPPGFISEEMNLREITEFIRACDDYCNVIENYKNYSVKDFLYRIQKCLVNYYLKCFDLPDTCGSEKNILDSHTIKIDYDNSKKYFPVSPKELVEFIGEHNIYWSNFNPYPDDNDIGSFQHNLAYDLTEIYEDIKSNLIVIKTDNIYNQQQALWQFKFDWQSHTGDHWTFAVRAIHWKLQDLQYDE